MDSFSGDASSKDSFNSARSKVCEIDCTGKNIRELVFMPQIQEAGQGGFGLAYIKGPLLDAVEKGQRVILKNIDKAKPGTEDILHGFVSLSTGELSSVKVYSPIGEVVTLEADKVKGFQLEATATNVDNIMVSLQARFGRHLKREETTATQNSADNAPKRTP